LSKWAVANLAREFNHEDNDEELRTKVIAETSAEIRAVAESGKPKHERSECISKQCISEYVKQFEGQRKLNLDWFKFG
jgi:hypothetical protein